MSAPQSKEDWPADLRDFAACWNEGRFFDAHETLEPRWIASKDRGLRGLIQLAAAFLHLQRGNIVGARTTLERAVMRLDDAHNQPCPIDQRLLAQYARDVLALLDTTPLTKIVTDRPRL